MAAITGANLSKTIKMSIWLFTNYDTQSGFWTNLSLLLMIRDLTGMRWFFFNFFWCCFQGNWHLYLRLFNCWFISEKKQKNSHNSIKIDFYWNINSICFILDFWKRFFFILQWSKDHCLTFKYFSISMKKYYDIQKTKGVFILIFNYQLLLKMAQNRIWFI